MSGYSATDTDRRMANTITIGRIKAVDTAKGLAQVDLDGPGTDWIPWTAARAGGDRTWKCPEVGEQVVVAAPGGELANAVIIGSLYQNEFNEPADSADIDRTVYKDGTVVEYDRAAHQYKIDVSASSGSVVVICKTAAVQASESVTLDTPDVFAKGNMTVDGMLTYKGGMAGTNGAGGKAATITGGINFQGGELTHDGKNIGSTHQHSNGNGGGNTGAPI